MTEQTNSADEEKRLGNEAFAAKNYDLAITHYDKAISLDPENAVYYSNKSACYAGKLMWKESMGAAEIAVSKDPKFVKGYYRLAVAQVELGHYDDAIQTLHTALEKEPDNEMLVKQLKAVRSKRSSAQNAVAQKSIKKLTEAQKKEIIELQEQINNHNRDLRGVQLKITGLQREVRMIAAAQKQLDGLPETVPLYRSVGKAFVAAPSHGFVKDKLTQEQEDHAKSIKDLLDRQEYLERRIASNTANLKDLTQGL